MNLEPLYFKQCRWEANLVSLSCYRFLHLGSEKKYWLSRIAESKCHMKSNIMNRNESAHFSAHNIKFVRAVQFPERQLQRIRHGHNCSGYGTGTAAADTTRAQLQRIRHGHNRSGYGTGTAAADTAWAQLQRIRHGHSCSGYFTGTTVSASVAVWESAVLVCVVCETVTGKT